MRLQYLKPIYATLICSFLLSSCSIVDSIDDSLADTITYEEQFSLRLDSDLSDVREDDSADDIPLAYSDDDGSFSSVGTWVQVYTEPLISLDRELKGKEMEGEQLPTDTLDYYAQTIRDRWDLEDATHELIEEEEITISGQRAKMTVFEEKNDEFHSYAVLITLKGAHDVYGILTWCPVAAEYFDKRACKRMAQSFEILGPSTEHERLTTLQESRNVKINDQYSLELENRFIDSRKETSPKDKLLIYQDTTRSSWVVVYSEPTQVTRDEMTEYSINTPILDYYENGIRARWDLSNARHEVIKEEKFTHNGLPAKLLIYEEENEDFHSYIVLMTVEGKDDIYSVLSWCPIVEDYVEKEACLSIAKTLTIHGPSEAFKRQAL